jgi:hypothetical protein
MENENEKCLKQKRNFFVKFWWIFPIVNLVSALLIVPSANHNLWGLTSALFIVFVVLLVVQGIIFIYCLCKKEWWQSVGSAIGCIVCFIAFYIISFIYLIVSSSQPDPFGKEHPIPEGMEYEIPLNENAHVEVIVDGFSEKECLQVWNDFQGGLYQYSFYYPELPDGDVFLRCFEVTENIELSTSRLRKASTVKVIDHTEFGMIADKQNFTIYEGDWGDYYVARIEVWYKNARTGKETKLLEKIYRVEGWMR